MASALSFRSATGTPDAAKLEVFRDALYEACQRAGSEEQLFSQLDLLELNVVPRNDPQLLLRVVQLLTNDRLLVAVNNGRDGLSWKWRDRNEAQKYKLCTTDEQAMVYALIDDAGGDGIWTQTLKRRLNIHDNVLNTAIKFLVGKQLISPFKSVEYPNRKMYIKASIRPSDRATGGPWYSDQTLDDAFIEELQRVIFDILKNKSAYRSSHDAQPPLATTSTSTVGAASHAQTLLQPTKGVARGGAPPQSKKRTADEMSDDTAASSGSGGAHATPKKSHADTCLPLPAGYTKYPTVKELARIISGTGITGNEVLSEANIQALVDVLVYDGLIEPVSVGSRKGYRLARIPRQSNERWSAGRPDEGSTVQERGMPEPYITALTEAPCGRCPVFDLCEEGGDVGPSNCPYYQRWLGLD